MKVLTKYIIFMHVISILIIQPHRNSFLNQDRISIDNEITKIIVS